MTEKSYKPTFEDLNFLPHYFGRTFILNDTVDSLDGLEVVLYWIDKGYI